MTHGTAPGGRGGAGWTHGPAAEPPLSVIHRSRSRAAAHRLQRADPHRRGRRGVRGRADGLQRHVRPPARGARPGDVHRRRRARTRVRPRGRPGRRRPRWWPLGRRLLHDRGRPAPRPGADEGHRRRPGGAAGSGAAGGCLGRARPGDAGARAGHHRRADDDDGRRRLHARQRQRLAGAAVRIGVRQPARRGGRHRIRRRGHRERVRAPGSAVGPARRRRQFRHRHRVHAFGCTPWARRRTAAC